MPNSLCRIIDLNDLPAVDAAVCGGEVHTDSEHSSRVVGERAGVAFLFDLREGFVRGGVGLDLDDVDVVLGLDEDVDAAVGGRALCLDIFPHQLDDDVHRVLEVFLAVALDLVVCPGEEGVQTGHEALWVAGFDIHRHEGYEGVGGVALDRGVVSQQEVKEAVLHLHVRESERVKVEAWVEAFDGEVAALVKERDRVEERRVHVA